MTPPIDSATPRSRPGWIALIARFRFTLALVIVLIVVGVASRALWEPFQDSTGWNTWAYGLPALESGRWWTPVTGTFLVSPPWAYLLTVISLWGIAYLEHRRGWIVAAAYFGIGQLFGVLATSLVLWLCALAPAWPWAHDQAATLSVGPGGGAYACMAAAVGLFAPPWRTRGWLVLLAFVSLAVLFRGTFDDLGKALAVGLILVVDRTLRVQRSTAREQRQVAFVAVVAVGILGLITDLVPTSGPFGHTEAFSGGFWNTATSFVVIILIAEGLRHARRWAWVIAIVLAALNAALGMLLLVLLVVVAWLDATALGDALHDGAAVDVAVGMLWLGVLVSLILVRRAFRWRRRGALGTAEPPSHSDVVAELERTGGGTLSWMTTWDGNSYARTSTGIVAYQRRAGAAIALADPLGEASGRAQSVAEFIAMSERAGLVPCFFSCDEQTRQAVPAHWRSLIVADDTIVDLPGLQFTGKRWGPVRTSLNRAGREQMTFRMTHLNDQTWGVRAQLHAISESWVGDKGLPEMGFTLGTLEQAEDPHVRLALAISPSGDVDGFLSWLPVYGDGRVRGWTLDLMRRRDGGFGPVMEYLIGSSAVVFRDEGADLMSLSGAPLAHEYPPDAQAIAQLSDRLADLLEPVYGFQSLHRFKEKFHPRYDTMYLLYREESDLPRISAGLTRAFLPDATLRQFAGAGMELLRDRDT